MLEKETVGRKNDIGKLQWSLLPYDALTEVVRVFQYGADKYGLRNWEAGMQYNRLFDAAMRHMTKWIGGDDVDDESKLHHLAHAAVSILMLLTYEIRQRNIGFEKTIIDKSLFPTNMDIEVIRHQTMEKSAMDID